MRDKFLASKVRKERLLCGFIFSFSREGKLAYSFENNDDSRTSLK